MSCLGSLSVALRYMALQAQSHQTLLFFDPLSLSEFIFLSPCVVVSGEEMK